MFVSNKYRMGLDGEMDPDYSNMKRVRGEEKEEVRCEKEVDEFVV